ncbi:MAG TPA: lysylphosphatidylglycerol synthase transmembrane domain-containing protein [Longimicrobium sp.]|jgi:hypothetical protein|uniref:lysylphosphatidylglycerol synthase transmembrane domain-containing protein n=1 Tax=Longimicrobium sp. TaxID=2029185 RepID=UPI002EDB2590
MKGHTKTVAGVAVTVFFLWLALRGVEWADVAANVRAANLPLLAAAVLTSGLGMHIRALRWKPLLDPVAPHVAWRPRIAAVCIGFATSNVIPARIGEFARTWVLSRQAGIPLTAAFASLVLERALDGIVIISFLLATMSLPGFPALATGDVDLQGAIRFVGVVTAVMLLGVLWMTFYPAPAVRIAERVAGIILPAGWRRPVLDALHAFLRGLDVLRSPRLLAISVAWALAQWSFLALSFLLAFRAFGITEPGYVGAVFLQSCIALAVAIPAGPGFFGPFEAASVWGLGLWGVDRARAVSFAIGFHLGGWFLVTAMGAWYALRLNVRLRDLRNSDTPVEEAVERDEALAGRAGRG